SSDLGATRSAPSAWERTPRTRASASPCRRRRAPPSSGAPRCRPVEDGGLRDGYDARSAPLPDVVELCDDLVLEVPRQDEDVVRLGLGDPRGFVDRDAGTGGVPAVLVGVAVDRVVEEVRTDAAVVEEGVSFARSPVADHARPVTLDPDKEVEQLALGLADSLGEQLVSLRSFQS